jgi:hypothetical protein
MRWRPLVVREVPREQATQVPFAEDAVIQAFAPHGADHPLEIGVLPRTVWRRQDLLNPA